MPISVSVSQAEAIMRRGAPDQALELTEVQRLAGDLASRDLAEFRLIAGKGGEVALIGALVDDGIVASQEFNAAAGAVFRGGAGGKRRRRLLRGC
jgi:hypothetical protein